MAVLRGALVLLQVWPLLPTAPPARLASTAGLMVRVPLHDVTATQHDFLCLCLCIPVSCTLKVNHMSRCWLELRLDLQCQG